MWNSSLGLSSGAQFKRAEVGGEAIKAPQMELSVSEEEREQRGAPEAT